jgi:hypothetical protein
MQLVASILIASSLTVAGTMRADPAVRRQTPPAALPADQAPVPQSYAFPSGAGMLFFYVKPDKTTDFEAVAARLGSALDGADDPVRKQQAAGWHILKSVETTKDAAIYVFVFDPAVAGADYDPVKVLSEKQPADIRALYEKLRDATIRVERMGLTKLR